MPRRLVVLLTSARDISNSALLCALLQESGAHPLFFQSSAHSFCVYPGWHQQLFFHSSILNSLPRCPASPLEATLTDDPRVLAEISRNRPPTSPFDATLTGTSAVTPLDATLTKNQGVGGVMLTSCHENAGAACCATTKRGPPVPCVAWAGVIGCARLEFGRM